MKEKLKTMKLKNYLYTIKQDVAIFALPRAFIFKAFPALYKILVCLLMYWIYCLEKTFTIKI